MGIAIFSDLDGTLLDGRTYSFEAARPALARLAALGVPLILSSSKTRREIEVWRERLANRDPFIVENGGAAFLPRAAEYDVIEFGDRYTDLVDALESAARETGCAVRGFHDLDTHAISELTGLAPDDAERARAREYDEPFEILDAEPECRDRLLAAIEARGKRWTKGRFYHITGNNDKGRALRALAEIYRKHDARLRTIGIGDAWNDVPLLRETDVAIVMPSPEADGICEAVPGARVAPEPGPAGWNAAVLGLLRG